MTANRPTLPVLVRVCVAATAVWLPGGACGAGTGRGGPADARPGRPAAARFGPRHGVGVSYRDSSAPAASSAPRGSMARVASSTAAVPKDREREARIRIARGTACGVPTVARPPGRRKGAKGADRGRHSRRRPPACRHGPVRSLTTLSGSRATGPVSCHGGARPGPHAPAQLHLHAQHRPLELSDAHADRAGVGVALLHQ